MEWLSLQYITLLVRDESFWSGSYDDMGTLYVLSLSKRTCRRFS
jgi:hypothetical protein